MDSSKQLFTETKLARLLAVLLVTLSSTFFITGCEDQGPAEEAGESIDDAADDAGDGLDDATDS